MSITTPDAPSEAPVLMIVPWHDPVVDAVGFDARSTYVELFWLNVLGPTATWILRRLVIGLDRYPLGYELDLAETANALGLGYSASGTSPFTRALQRCAMFGVAQPFTGGLAVRRRVPPVAARHLARMPPHLRDVHAEWVASRTPLAPDHDRARLLAAAMVATGDDPDVVERQLLALGVSPHAATEVTAGLLSA
jgi:hypothetical protein